MGKNTETSAKKLDEGIRAGSPVWFERSVKGSGESVKSPGFLSETLFCFSVGSGEPSEVCV